MSGHLLTIDFETYYAPDYQLGGMTTESYVRDPRFQVIGVGVKIDGNPPDWLEEAEFRRLVPSVPWAKCAVLCHNTPFDGAILGWHYGANPKLWLDTLSMGRALHPAVEVGGSLAKLSAYYGVGAKGDEVKKALGYRREQFDQAWWLQYGEYCKNDCDLTLAIFQKMVGRLPDDELELLDLTLRMFIEPRFKLNGPLLQQYLGEEKARKAALLERIGAEREVLMSNDKFAQLLIDLGEVPPTKVSKTTGLEAFAFAKTDPGMKELLEHPRDEVRWAAEARVGIKSTINETRTERLLGMSKRGAAPVYLKYAGAHTHRWSGGDKVNWQNFQRGGVLRDAVEAPEGHVLVVVDSSAIEARGVAWLANHQTLLADFAAGTDVYAKFASDVYGRTITKDTDPNERFVGKVCILGLGYGMGWFKFALTMAAGAMGGPAIIFGEKECSELGISVDQMLAGQTHRVEEMPSRLPLEARMVHSAVAKFIVERYRKANPEISKGLWGAMFEVIEAMGEVEDADTVRWQRLVVARHAIRRPNGMVLRYPGLEVDEDGASYMGGAGGKERVRVYGGSLTENVTQALARDVVAWQMLQLKKVHGYRPALMTHDEIVFVVPEAEGAEALARALEMMTKKPEWAEGWPLAAEGAFGKTYGECK